MRTEDSVEAVFDGLLDYYRTYAPVEATAFGDHSLDAELDDWGTDGISQRVGALDSLSRRLDGLGALDAQTAGDRALLADALAAQRFQLETLRAPETDPSFYLDVATGGVFELIRRDDLPAGPRQRAAARRAAQVPRLLAQARANLDAIPEPHRGVALLRAPGSASLFRDALVEFAPESQQAAEEAARACEEFAAWLEEDRGPVPDWRLGGERWAGALRLALGVQMPPEQVWERGLAAMEELQAEAEELSARVLGRAGARLRGPELVRAALDEVARDHAERSALVSDARGILAEIRDFLRAGDLFDLPEPDNLRVEEVPSFQQGMAVAFFMPAPPLEPSAPHTYYLSPVPDDWDDARAESFLREYNRQALRSVGIHEAYPGHYAQLAAAQRHPRLLRRALLNSAFAEGWAVYVEREVVAAGFGGDEADSLRLVSTKMDMRAVANALLDQGLHVHGWDDDKAMALMTQETYQEDSEAQGKLVRGKVTAGQLSSYFVGAEEMADLRRDVEAARGSAFEAKEFHNDVLAQGIPPFAVLRAALLPDDERMQV